MQFSRDAIGPAAAVTQTNPRHVLHDERASKHAPSFGTTLFERKQLQTTHLDFDPICSRTLWGSSLPSSRAPRTFRTSRFAACYLLVINYDPDSLDHGVQSQPARSETFCHRLPLRIEAFTKRITLGLHCPVPLRSQDKRTFLPNPSITRIHDRVSIRIRRDIFRQRTWQPPASCLTNTQDIPTGTASTRSHDPPRLRAANASDGCFLAAFLMAHTSSSTCFLASSRSPRRPLASPVPCFFTQSYSLSHRALAVTHPPCGKSG